MISPGQKKSELIEPHCFFEGSVHMENPFQNSEMTLMQVAE